jgi:O-antigen ligase
MVDWVVVIVGLGVVAAAVLIAGAGVGLWGGRGRVTGKAGTGGVTAAQAQGPSTLAQKVELPLLLLLAPVFLFSAKISVLGLAVILGLWVWRRLALGFFLPRTPLDWPLAVTCAMIPVGMLVSPDMDWSAGRAELLLYGVALYYAIVAWVTGPARLEMATLAYLAAGSAMAVLALVGTAWQYRVPVLSDVAQFFPQIAQGLSRDSTGFHPNIVAGALLWVVMPLTALFMDAWSGRKEPKASGLGWYGVALRDHRLLGALLLLTGGTLALTQSRGALIGALAGLGILAWVFWPRLRPVVAAAGVVGVVALGAMLTAWWNAGSSQNAGAAPPINISDENFEVRLDTWRSALHGIREYPLTGVGLDAFRKLMPVRYPALSVPDSYDIGHAHNQLLQSALDLGLPGLVGFLAVWLAAGMMVVVIGRRTKGEPTLASRLRPSSLTAGIGAALVASFAHGLTDTVVMVSKPGVLFWAMLALLAASWRLTPMERESTLQR